MEANGGGHALANGGVGHAPANGGGGHAPANGEGGHAPANGGGGHALANGGGGHALANGGGGHAPANGGGGHALYLAFLCLPAQEIALCRRVCRLWRDITGTEAFRLDHHHHRCRRPMPLLVIPDHGLARCSIHAADTRDLAVRPVIRYPLGHGSMLIHGSCGGIILLSLGRRLYACNPCTRRWASLPPVHVDDSIVGFYETDNGFHVLYRDCEEPDCMYWIFRLEANPIERFIGRPQHEGEAVELDLVLANGIAPSYAIPPVRYNVYLCWLPRAVRGTSDILMYDTAAEAFSLIPPPTIQVGGEDIPVVLGDQLFEMHQHLAMTFISPTGVDVWVRSNITDLWSHRYRILRPMNVLLATGVFAVARERDHLLQSPHIMLAGTGIFFSRHTIQESLLLHPAALPLQDTDAVVGDPPFFRNQ
jgi:hypothetical protein